MKRKLKSIAGIAMAATMAVAGSTSLFAADKAWDLGGDVTSVDISVTLPTGGANTLTVKPYAKTQIDSGINYIKSGFAYANMEDAVAYKTSIAGYVATVKTAGENAPVLKADSTWTGTTKQINLKIEMGKDVYLNQTQTGYDSAITGTTDDDFAVDGLTTALTKDAEKKAHFTKHFATAADVKSVIAERASDAAYDPKDASNYTKATCDEVALQPGKAIPVRVTGTMNTDAPWEVGDGIGITPIFKFTPDAANTAVSPSSSM